MKIKIKLLNRNGKIPTKAHKTDACYDVYAASVLFDEENQTVVYGLGFATEIPVGYKGIIVPRSSFTKTNWVMQNTPAQVDASYRGEWIVKFKCVDYAVEAPFKENERIAQIFFEKVLDIEFEEVDTLTNTERGSGGFGSSGK
jgi:dUTP pyrophosphatase